MARINVEQKALGDLRYQTLGRRYKKDRFWGLGRMVYVWNQCQELERHSLTPSDLLDLFPELKGFAQAIVDAKLAEWNEDGSVYIAGTKGRIEWLGRQREIGRQGGKKGGRPVTHQETPMGLENQTPGGKDSKTPPAPSPAPAVTTPPPPSFADQDRREAQAFWQTQQGKIQQAVTKEVFRLWFAPLEPVAKNGVLTLRAPNVLARSFLMENFGEMLADMGIVLCE